MVASMAEGETLTNVGLFRMRVDYGTYARLRDAGIAIEAAYQQPGYDRHGLIDIVVPPFVRDVFAMYTSGGRPFADMDFVDFLLAVDHGNYVNTSKWGT